MIKLSRLGGRTFSGSELTAIHIPRSVKLIYDNCFSSCRSLLSATFANDCEISRLDRAIFCGRGLTDIHIPPSVEVFCESSFCHCKLLQSVVFPGQCKLSRFERSAFSGNGLSGIHIPGSVPIMSERCFLKCQSIVSVYLLVIVNYRDWNGSNFPGTVWEGFTFRRPLWWSVSTAFRFTNRFCRLLLRVIVNCYD
jgi:hypothetical protein